MPPTYTQVHFYVLGVVLLFNYKTTLHNLCARSLYLRLLVAFLSSNEQFLLEEINRMKLVFIAAIELRTQNSDIHLFNQ